MKNTALNKRYLVVGLGQTGLSCVRFLRQQNIPVMVADTRDNPPGLKDCRAKFPEVSIHLGPFSKKLFSQADVLVMSPGVALDVPEIATARQQGVKVISDIELFVNAAKAPIIAITGSNGKSTLATLVGQMINDTGLKAIVCGNIGLPVLDVLAEPVPDYYVVELSSFHLEITDSLQAKVAIVLNISPDHLDRYPSFDAYLSAKKRIYHNCEIAVVNADEPEIWTDLFFKKTPERFTLSAPQENVWGVKANALFYGEKKIVDVASLLLKEKHHCQNFLAALAIGSAIHLPLDKMVKTIKTFSGLPHRCQLVSQKNHIHWINDSKATNEGAAVAAINSVAQHMTGQLILIAGGDSKGVALNGLRDSVSNHVACVITLGKDGNQIAETLAGCADIFSVNTIREAVLKASTIANSGDTVLLSPACASLDQYANFMARGDDFVQAVEAI